MYTSLLRVRPSGLGRPEVGKGSESQAWAMSAGEDGSQMRVELHERWRGWQPDESGEDGSQMRVELHLEDGSQMRVERMAAR